MYTIAIFAILLCIAISFAAGAAVQSEPIDAVGFIPDDPPAQGSCTGKCVDIKKKPTCDGGYIHLHRCNYGLGCCIKGGPGGDGSSKGGGDEGFPPDLQGTCTGTCVDIKKSPKCDGGYIHLGRCKYTLGCCILGYSAPNAPSPAGPSGGGPSGGGPSGAGPGTGSGPGTGTGTGPGTGAGPGTGSGYGGARSGSPPAQTPPARPATAVAPVGGYATPAPPAGYQTPATGGGPATAPPAGYETPAPSGGSVTAVPPGGYGGEPPVSGTKGKVGHPPSPTPPSPEKPKSTPAQKTTKAGTTAAVKKSTAAPKKG